MRRHFEDFFLAVAELVTAFDPADFTAHTSQAPALDWVGVVVDLSFPEDAEGGVETFAELAVATSTVDSALGEALAELGVPPAESCWTAAPDSAARSGAGLTVLARPRPAQLDESAREFVEQCVRSAAGQELTVRISVFDARLPTNSAPRG